MADIASPIPVKLICGLIAADEIYLRQAAEILRDRFGPTDVVSETWAFDFTDYYAPQMGENLLRGFLAFENLIDPGRLVAIKRATNAIEDDLAHHADVARPVNLDPGYMTQAKLILASAKDFAHRIYLADGIYGEVTLQYREGWQKLPWTFPDYASGRYAGFLDRTRIRLREQLKELP